MKRGGENLEVEASRYDNPYDVRRQIKNEFLLIKNTRRWTFLTRKKIWIHDDKFDEGDKVTWLWKLTELWRELYKREKTLPEKVT